MPDEFGDDFDVDLFGEGSEPFFDDVNAWDGCSWVDDPDAWDELVSAVPSEYPGERAWLSFAARTLAAEAGLDGGARSVTLTELQLDVCVVAALTRSFHYAADGEDPDHWEWAEWNLAADAVSAAIEVGRILQGYAIEYHPPFDGASETMTEAVKAYARRFRGHVLNTLAQTLGVGELFASLWASRTKSSRFPIDEEALAILKEPRRDVQRALDWFLEQFDEERVLEASPSTPRWDQPEVAGHTQGDLPATSAAASHSLAVGEPYGLGRVPASDGAGVRFTPTFSDVLVRFTAPTESEVRNFQGQAEFAAVLVSEDVLVFAAKFGDEAWLDMPFQAGRLDEDLRGIPQGDVGEPILLRTVLVDSADGRVVTTRVDELDPDVSSVVRIGIHKQLEKPYDDAAAQAHLTRLNEHYSTPSEMVNACAHARCESVGPQLLDVSVHYYG